MTGNGISIILLEIPDAFVFLITEIIVFVDIVVVVIIVIVVVVVVTDEKERHW